MATKSGIKGRFCIDCGGKNSWVQFRVSGKWMSGSLKYERIEVCRECMALRLLGGEQFYKYGLNRQEDKGVAYAQVYSKHDYRVLEP